MDDMQVSAGGLEALHETKEVKQKCADALAELQQKSQERGMYLGKKAEVAVENCAMFSLSERLRLQSEISSGYVYAGLHRWAAELDVKIEQAIERLEDAQEGKVLQEELVLRSKNYEGFSAFVDSRFNTTQAARFHRPQHNISASTSEDRSLWTEEAQQNNRNVKCNASALPQVGWDDLPPASSTRRGSGDSARTKSLPLDPLQQIRSLPGPAANEAIFAMDTLKPGLEVTHHDLKSRVMNIQPLDKAALSSTPVGAGYGHFANIDQDEASSKAAEWFRWLRGTHQFIGGQSNEFQLDDNERVRVAVLDTGFSDTTKEMRTLTQSFSGKVTKRKAFVADDDNTGRDIDSKYHGTQVLYQLSRVCPNAILYSYRVAQRNKEGALEANAAAVTAALKQAIKDKIDVVNMSFGWPHDDQDVESALRLAQDSGILLFASVSNDGALGIRNILYPASSKNVTAVDAADGLGEPATFNTMTKGTDNKPRFSAPGVEVLGFMNTPINGSSYSSPIAAGIAALVLEFANQKPLEGDDTITFLRKTEGMETVLRLMQVQKTELTFMFLKPWKLFYDGSGKAGGDGGPGSWRAHVAQRIVGEIQNRYGHDKGIGDVLEKRLRSRAA